MLQRIEMAMHIWTRKPINPSLRTARSIYMILFVNSMPCYNSDRGERTLHSVLQPRGDIYESGVTSTRLRTRLNERCRQNYRHGHLRDSCFSNVRHQSVHTSRHRIGEASAAVYRLQHCRDTGQRKLRNSSCFLYVFSGDDCTMQCIQGKILLRQLEARQYSMSGMCHKSVASIRA